MAMTILASVLGGLILAGIVGATKWLRSEDHRERLRQAACRHDWQPIDRGGDGIVFVSPYADECPKCGARR